MWLFSETGFISIVRHRDEPEVFVVRARDRISLEPLEAKTGLEIQLTPDADYPYRIFANETDVAELVAASLRDLRYPNFKSQVAKTRGADYAYRLHDVWQVMLESEDVEAKTARGSN